MVALFERQGRICSTSAVGEVHCSLTELGRRTLRLGTMLRARATPLRQQAPQVSVTDFSQTPTFDLMSALEGRGWRCECTPRRRSPPPYVAAGPKIWYIQPTTKDLNPLYLRALLEAPRHGQPVFVFRTNAYYEHILKGLAWESRGEKRRLFRIRDADGESQAAAPQPLRDRPLLALPACGGPAPDTSDHGPSGPDDASNASPSEASVAVDDEERNSADEAVAEAVGMARAAATLGRPTMETTMIWKGFRFTAVWKDDSQVGWEVVCWLHEPYGECRKRRLFAVNGGRERTELLLKTWCVQGLAFLPEELESHMTGMEEIGEPMSHEALEAFEVPTCEHGRHTDAHD